MKHLVKMRYQAELEGVNITWCDIWHEDRWNEEVPHIQMVDTLEECECEKCKDNFFENGFNE